MPALMISVSGVRGIVGPDFHPMVVARWTAALSRILPPGPVVLGRDSRRTGPVFSSTASAVFRSMGREVWDVGIVPTPTVQLAVELWNAAGGLILSASHNPAPWNACKFVDQDGGFLSPSRFDGLRRAHEDALSGFLDAEGYGHVRDRHDEAVEAHADAVLRAVDAEAIRSARLRVTLDTGHGAGGVLLPLVAERLRVDLDGRNLEPNGLFADNPEPSEDSLERILKSTESSVAFVGQIDPDADRFAVAVPESQILGEEWTLSLVAAGRLEWVKGPIVTNLSTTSRMDDVAARSGVPLYRTPVGEAHVVAAMRERSAVIGGEGNGGVIDPEVHLGRDAAVAFARLCEVEARHPGGLRALAENFAPRSMTKIKLPVSAELLRAAEPRLAEVLGPVEDRRDGLRFRLDSGFVHVRASNTEPVVRAIVEAESASRVTAIIQRVQQALGLG